MEHLGLWLCVWIIEAQLLLIWSGTIRARGTTRKERGWSTDVQALRLQIIILQAEVARLNRFHP
jgi:hypothetical protein